VGDVGEHRLSLLVLSAAAARSNENVTALELNGSPLWKRTPARSLKAQVLLSGVALQLSASSVVMRLSAFTLLSVSNTL
jgi:hypothetical protein